MLKLKIQSTRKFKIPENVIYWLKCNEGYRCNIHIQDKTLKVYFIPILTYMGKYGLLQGQIKVKFRLILPSL
jgi:hypothetical protein